MNVARDDSRIHIHNSLTCVMFGALFNISFSIELWHLLKSKCNHSECEHIHYTSCVVVVVVVIKTLVVCSAITLSHSSVCSQIDSIIAHYFKAFKSDNNKASTNHKQISLNANRLNFKSVCFVMDTFSHCFTYIKPSCISNRVPRSFSIYIFCHCIGFEWRLCFDLCYVCLEDMNSDVVK